VALLSYFSIDITYLGDDTWCEGEGHETEVTGRFVPLETKKKRIGYLDGTKLAS
jgi:hypothetical protein